MFQLYRLPVEKTSDQIRADQEDERSGMDDFCTYKHTYMYAHVHTHKINACPYAYT